MKIGDLSGLAPTLSTEQAAEVFGVGVDHLWALARAGEAPVEPLRLGHRLRWPTAAVLRAVGIDATAEPDASEAPVVALRREASR